jgi:hypothetical protein
MEKQLLRFLNVIVKEKFPMVEKILVQTISENPNYYKVSVGVSPESLAKYPDVTKNKIMEFVKQSSLYVIGSNPKEGKIYWVEIFDPSREN